MKSIFEFLKIKNAYKYNEKLYVNLTHNVKELLKRNILYSTSPTKKYCVMPALIIQSPQKFFIEIYNSCVKYKGQVQDKSDDHNSIIENSIEEIFNSNNYVILKLGLYGEVNTGAVEIKNKIVKYIENKYSEKDFRIPTGGLTNQLDVIFKNKDILYDFLNNLISIV